MGKTKSWVWQFAERKGDTAFCLVCDDNNNNEFTCKGGSTGAIGNHLKHVHGKYPSDHPGAVAELNQNEVDEVTRMECNESRDIEVIDPLPSTSSTSVIRSFSSALQLKRKRLNTSTRGRICTQDRTERIHQALAKMIGMSQLPLSFASCPGFIQFMETVEPGYNICRGSALKKRLDMLYDKVKCQIKEELDAVTNVACTSDCWTSRGQQSYLTVTVHLIDYQWTPKSYTLTTQLMEARHTSENLCNAMEDVLKEWNILDKTVTVVTDNAANVVNAVRDMSSLGIKEKGGLTCAAHSVQLVANKALEHKTNVDVCQKASKIVGHFRHSNVATSALETKQDQLGFQKQKLIQSVKTRWNSSFEMLQRLLENRLPITSVLTDRTLTTRAVAEKLDMSEREWTQIAELVDLLKPLQMVTTVFCGDKSSPASMVRPLIRKVVKHHMQPVAGDSALTSEFKDIVVKELVKRFRLNLTYSNTSDNKDQVLTRLIAAFLDPRYKDLVDETPEVRQVVREYVRGMLRRNSEVTEMDVEFPKATHTSALAYLYNEPGPSQVSEDCQFEEYLSEPQLKFDLNHLEWWKARAQKYSALASLANKYLCIPATSASSERTFSTAGNIVTSKRSCLSSENVNILVFLYQNRLLYA